MCIFVLDKRRPLIINDGELEITKYQANVDQQKDRYLRLLSARKLTKSVTKSQNVDDRELKTQSADINSRFEQLQYDHRQLTEKYRAKRTEHEQLVQQFDEQLQERVQLEIKCVSLESEKKQTENLWSSQATEHQKLKQAYELLLSKYDRLKLEKQQETNSRVSITKQYEDLLLEHSQLQGKYSTQLSEKERLNAMCTKLETDIKEYEVLHSEYDQLVPEKKQEINSQMSQQTEYRKRYEDLLIEHNQLQERYSAQLSEKDQLNAKCIKLETDIKELDAKYSSAKATAGSAGKYGKSSTQLFHSTFFQHLTRLYVTVYFLSVSSHYKQITGPSYAVCLRC